MSLQSSGAISLLNIQNEFKDTDANIQLATDVVKLPPTTWTDTNNPFPGRTPGTKSTISDPQIQLTGPIGIATTSYGGVTYTNTANDDQLPEYTIPINEYYRGGLYVSNDNPLQNQSIPTSGEVSFANFYAGIGSDIIKYITTNRENLNLETIFTGPEWVDTQRRKRVIIKKGVIIGGTTANADNYALRVSTNLAAGLTLINYGDIVGYGGASQGQDGGNALLFGDPPSSANFPITNIKHNFTSGMYGVVSDLGQVSAFDYRTLSPISSTTNTVGYAVTGTGEFNVNDVIVYNSNPDLVNPITAINTIIAKDTATFTAYISSGNLTSAGNKLSVISGTEPLVGMSIFGAPYKKHIVTSVAQQSFTNVRFTGTTIVNFLSLPQANGGYVVSGSGVLPGTVITANVAAFGASTGFLGTVTGNIFTANTPTTPIVIGMSMQIDGTQGYRYIINQISGTTGGAGTYTLNASTTSTNQSIVSGFYVTTNKSQTITSVNITGKYFVLNAETSDNISTENDLVNTETTLTGVRYILESNAGSNLRKKTSNNRFFTAGGNTPRGFIVTLSSSPVAPPNPATPISYVDVGESVTISGSVASIIPTATANTNIFNGTWTVASKSDANNTFLVNSDTIINSYYTTTTNGSVLVNTTIPGAKVNVPVNILNYGRIWAGGGGGSGGTKAARSQTSLTNLLANTFSDNTTGTVSGTNYLAIKVQLLKDGGYDGIGGVGQGYNQARTLGSEGLPNPNAAKYAYFESYNTSYSNTYPYLDLISVPPDTYVQLQTFGTLSGSATNIATPVTWKNLYLGSGSINMSVNNIPISTIYTNIASSTSTYHFIKIGNLYTFGTANTIKFLRDFTSAGFARINNLYRNPSQTITVGTNWSVGSYIDNTTMSNPQPTDRIRVVTTAKPVTTTVPTAAWPSITYDIFFPTPFTASKAGDGGDWGSDGQTVTGATIAAGKKGNYIINNNASYWVNLGDVKGGTV